MEKPKYYAYFFTRQDISPEQQLVQTAHAALKLGKLMAKDYDPDNLYFTVVGVRNEDALKSVIMLLDKFGMEWEMFREPDIGNAITSIAAHPLAEYNREPLLAFNLLKIG